eukprot:2835972-Prymnesium_polylepis.1
MLCGGVLCCVSTGGHGMSRCACALLYIGREPVGRTVQSCGVVSPRASWRAGAVLSVEASALWVCELWCEGARFGSLAPGIMNHSTLQRVRHAHVLGVLGVRLYSTARTNDAAADQRADRRERGRAVQAVRCSANNACG